MKIISNFRDYYDCIMSTGIDKTVIYNRNIKTIDFHEIFSYKKIQEPQLKFIINQTAVIESKSIFDYFSFQTFLIGFCNYIYPCILMTEYQNNQNKNTYIYTTDELRLKMLKYAIQIKTHKQNKRMASLLKTLNDFLLFPWHIKYNSYFIEYKVPIFVLKHKNYGLLQLILNSELKQYNFYKVKEPYIAFQEIYMFISGVLGTESKPLIQISDNDMRDKKGFDKWSFKKLPTKKRKRK